MLRYLPVVFGLILIVVLGIFQGIWSDRWTDPAVGAKEFAARLANVPMDVGNWKGTDHSAEANPRTLAVAGAVGHISREYRNKLTDQTVSVYLVCGHSRKITGHTPNVCYPASGFVAIGAQTRQPIEWDDTSADFYTKSFRKESVDGNQNLRVFWAWTTDGKWQAPDSPRRTFPHVRALYKLYLISPLAKRNEQPYESAAIKFAQVFMPALQKGLFPDNSTTTPAPADNSKAAGKADTAKAAPATPAA